MLTIFISLVFLFSLFSSAVGAAPAVPVSFTILHTNDFHGQLEASGSNPGMARVATIINGVRTAKGASNVLLVDAGDEMQGSLLSNLGDGTATGKGAPTIGTYNAMGYNVATFGNHEFDWGQVNLANRTTEAAYPYVTANIVKNNTGNCANASWQKPDFADNPFEILTVGTAPNTVKVAFIGVTTAETPTITISTATAGLCFKDPAESIIYYYAAMKAAGADVIVVLSHLGNTDGGYGYGIPVYGDQTLAAKLNTAGKPVNLIIGGHSHTNLTAAQTVGTTKVVQAYYNGRRVGQADITVGTDGGVAVTWVTLTVFPPPTPPAVTPPATPVDATILGVINSFKTPAYMALVNTPIGYSQVDLSRWQTLVVAPSTFAAMSDNMMGAFIDDAIYNYLNSDAEPANDIDMFFNNAGGIRTDWCWNGTSWVNTGCTSSGLLAAPALLTYGNMFTVLPFGNATVVGKMTGAQILEVLNFAPNAASGLIQPAGLKFKYFKYADTLAPGSPTNPYPYAWGAYDVCVVNKVSGTCEPLDLKKVYNVGTNEFLAPAGGDSYNAFKYMTNVTYWGDMLNAVNAYVTAHYGTPTTAYKGPNGDGTLDGRIGLNGDGDFTYDAGEIVPLTILHHNDSHGNLYKSGSYAGYTQLATLIDQERAHNPSRTLLFTTGDNIQGDGLSFYFKNSYSGFAVDGAALDLSTMTNPIIAVMNAMGYDAATLGNHEYNFGSDVFKGALGQANFPFVDATVTDGAGGFTYGLGEVNGGVGVQPFIEKTIGAEGIKVGILGLGNPRIPNYELASNIKGLTFANEMDVNDPITRARDISTTLHTSNDVVIALSHLGFTDTTDHWVDTYLATNTIGIDAIIGGHSHTDPTNSVAYPYLGTYKYLPSIVPASDGKPVVINQAYRYNYYLGEVVLGLRAKSGGGYEVVSETGRNVPVVVTSTVEKASITTIINPYRTLFNTYNTTPVGITTAPIRATLAFTEETTGANLQADAAVYELATKNSIPVDFHLSGAMTNRDVATTATPTTPVTLKVSDMFSLMPYENSLVVLKMNGPELKTVLERAYFNYWNYKYTLHSSISYYTTCMLDTNAGNQITYNDKGSGTSPDGNNVVSLNIGGQFVDFTDATTFYNVSTVNYLAAGSCNFNNGPGTSLWPLAPDRIVADTQFYVRDAVIDYLKFMGTVSPAIETRLSFITDLTPPVITINAPIAKIYGPTDSLTLDFSATDAVSGVKKVEATLDGNLVTTAQVIDLTLLAQGDHTLTVTAVDKAGNASGQAVTFGYDSVAPEITIITPVAKIYSPLDTLTLDFSAADAVSGVKTLEAQLDGIVVTNGQVIDLTTLSQGDHTLVVKSVDNIGNEATKSVTFGYDSVVPVITINAPVSQTYLHPDSLTLDFNAVDAVSGLNSMDANLDGTPVTSGQVVDLYTLSLGDHTLTVHAVDNVGNETSASVTFTVTATSQSLVSSVNRFFTEGLIDNGGTQNSLLQKLGNAQKDIDKGKRNTAINKLEAFINEVQAQSGKHITVEAASLLIADAQWVIAHLK
jgi:2',3'-cyclic-nucleotide 2'-phosphodiesterase/3'-nucleotidase